LIKISRVYPENDTSNMGWKRDSWRPDLTPMTPPLKEPLVKTTLLMMCGKISLEIIDSKWKWESYMGTEHLDEMERHYRACACRSTTPVFSTRKQKDSGSTQDKEGNYYRTFYQHDRDKILYSRSFRRLRLKTQIFPEHTSDHLRTRLDHTLEVAQIARHLARQLFLNEDLVDAIALGHDIGHAPFAHSGERALHRFLKAAEERLEKDIDGFRHNWQGLRVVDKLEKAYHDAEGLNLTKAVRIGILKHTGLEYKEKDLKGPCFCDMKDEIGKEFSHGPQSPVYGIFEVQIAEIADEFAQAVHDFDDGVISGRLSLRECVADENEYPLIRDCMDGVKERWPEADRIDYTNSEDVSLLLHSIRSKLIFQLTIDVKEASTDKLKDWEAKNLKAEDKVKEFNNLVENELEFPRLIALDKKKDVFDEFRRKLNEKVIRSERVSRMDGKADYIIRKILDVYLTKPGQVPEQILNQYKSAKELPNKENVRLWKDEKLEQLGSDKVFIRAAVDYVAGMTDRFALREFDKLFSAYPRVEL
jgi:dGTPase